VIAVCLFSIPGIGRETFFYDPYPMLTIPAFNPLIGIMMLGLLLPGIMELKRLNEAGL
jgi:hypothetical protein